MNQYKVCIVGLGRIACLLEDDRKREKPCTHIGAYNLFKNFKVVAGCDINLKRCEYFKKRWKVQKLYTDYRKMIEIEKPDILSVCTWTDSHPEITIFASEYGVKLIICEKPIATDLKQAQRMIEVCRKNNTHLLINHGRRWDGKYIKTKQMISDNVIGEIRTVICNVLTNVPSGKRSFEIDRSSLLHDGTHLCDILRFLFGEPKWVVGFISQEVKEQSFGIYNFGKTTVFLEAGGLRNYFNFEVDIQGTSGRIIVGNETLKFYKSVPSKRYSEFYELEEFKFPKYNKINFFIREMKEVRELLSGKKKEITSSGWDGYKALEMIIGFLKSSRNNNKRVYFN